NPRRTPRRTVGRSSLTCSDSHAIATLNAAKVSTSSRLARRINGELLICESIMRHFTRPPTSAPPRPTVRITSLSFHHPASPSSGQGQSQQANNPCGRLLHRAIGDIQRWPSLAIEEPPAPGQFILHVGWIIVFRCA